MDSSSSLAGIITETIVHPLVIMEIKEMPKGMDLPSSLRMIGAISLSNNPISDFALFWGIFLSILYTNPD
jgi:hypothetical protein